MFRLRLANLPRHRRRFTQLRPVVASLIKIFGVPLKSIVIAEAMGWWANEYGREVSG